MRATTSEAGHGIDVGGVNGLEAMIDEGIEYLEAGLLVDRSTEDIAAGTSGAIARPVFFHPSGT